MTNKEEEVLRYLLKTYKNQWDKNLYARTQYDTDLKYYQGYRNAQEYPLAYNESFNRILPIIYTLLAKFMDQLYQTSNIVSVKPRQSVDLERAKRAEAVLNYQLESLNNIDTQGGSYLTIMKWLFNALTFGKGIVKVYWKKEERIGPRRIMLPKPSFDRFGNFQGMDVVDHISQEMQTLYDGPYIEVLHNKLFVPHPEYKQINQMPAVFLVYKRSMDYVKRQADKGIYKNIKELPAADSGGASTHSKDSIEGYIETLHITGAQTAEELKDERKSPEVDIIEAYARLIVDDAPYEVGSGIKIKGKEEEYIVHIGNYRTILSMEKSPYGTRPLFDIGCYMQPELYWDLGLVKLTQGLQNQINNLGNLRMHNAMMLVNQMMLVNSDADIDPAFLVMRPFGIIPVDAMDDVASLQIPDLNSNIFMEQENFYEHTIQDITGGYPYVMGQTPPRREQTGVVYSIQQMGEARAKLLLMSMDYLGIRPLLRYMMLLNTYHLPSGKEYPIPGVNGRDFIQIFGDDLHPDFDFAARYTAMEPALGKQARLETLLRYAGMWAESPWINQYQLIKTTLELADVREAELVLNDPKKVMQQMQAQQQQEMATMQAKEDAKAGGKLVVEQEKTKGKILLEAVKAEVAEKPSEST